MISVNEEFCPQNHKCPAQQHCPVGAIEQTNAFSAPSIDEEKCTDCGICTRVCHVFTKA
jgi:Fe-S-cluster-containing hydrogenase component 2